MLLKMAVHGEGVLERGYQSDCFAKQLGSKECRKGCSICNLEEKLEEVWDSFVSIEDGPGNKRSLYCILLYMLMHQKHFSLWGEDPGTFLKASSDL